MKRLLSLNTVFYKITYIVVFFVSLSSVFLTSWIIRRTNKKVALIERNECFQFHDFLYLIKSVLRSNQVSITVIGILKSKTLEMTPTRLDFFVN